MILTFDSCTFKLYCTRFWRAFELWIYNFGIIVCEDSLNLLHWSLFFNTIWILHQSEFLYYRTKSPTNIPAFAILYSQGFQFQFGVLFRVHNSPAEIVVRAQNLVVNQYVCGSKSSRPKGTLFLLFCRLQYNKTEIGFGALFLQKK